MSIEAVSLVLNQSKATGRAKLVLLGIANHLGDQGAWPSISTLARYANASERSVKRDIQELIELGELKVEVQNAPTRTQYKTNLYWLTIGSGVTDSASEVTAGGVLTLNRTITKPLKETTEKFDEFWNLYPKKIAKADAIKAWNKATKTKTADELLKLTKAYAEGKLPEDKYIPYPASWLNKGLYESVEVAEAKPLPKLFIGRVK
jgi:hypothetical protein